MTLFVKVPARILHTSGLAPPEIAALSEPAFRVQCPGGNSRIVPAIASLLGPGPLAFWRAIRVCASGCSHRRLDPAIAPDSQKPKVRLHLITVTNRPHCRKWTPRSEG